MLLFNAVMPLLDEGNKFLPVERLDVLPQRQPRPRGHGRGKVSLYPDGTRAQLQAFCELLSQDRDLPRVAWRMWWAGYPIPLRSARDLLAEAATAWEEWMRAFREELQADEAEQPDFSDAVWELMDASETARPRRKLLSQMRQRVGRASFPTLFRIILEMGTGSFTGYRTTPTADPRDDERLLVSKAIGTPRGRKTGRTLLDDPRIALDTEAFLKGVSNVLVAAHPRAALEAMTDAELLTARDELRTFEPLVAVLPELGEEAFGKRGRGVRDLADALMTMRPIDQAMTLLFWHELRLQGLGPTMDAYIRLAALAPLWLPVARAQMREERSAPTDSPADNS